MTGTADATVFTGLFYRDQIADCHKANGIPEPCEDTVRRKIVPETLERRVIDAFSNSSALFRKTSCAVSYAHGLPDYNGHYGTTSTARRWSPSTEFTRPEWPAGSS